MRPDTGAFISVWARLMAAVSSSASALATRARACPCSEMELSSSCWLTAYCLISILWRFSSRAMEVTAAFASAREALAVAWAA